MPFCVSWCDPEAVVIPLSNTTKLPHSKRIDISMIVARSRNNAKCSFSDKGLVVLTAALKGSGADRWIGSRVVQGSVLIAGMNVVIRNCVLTLITRRVSVSMSMLSRVILSPPSSAPWSQGAADLKT